MPELIDEESPRLRPTISDTWPVFVLLAELLDAREMFPDLPCDVAPVGTAMLPVLLAPAVLGDRAPVMDVVKVIEPLRDPVDQPVLIIP